MENFQSCDTHLDGTPCPSYRPGHRVHFVQLRLAGDEPWQWRDAVVTGVAGLEVGLRYLAGDHDLTVRHHHPLAALLHPGTPVSLHERYSLLLCGDTAYSVSVTGGLGEVAQPAIVGPGPLLVAEVATGHGRAVHRR